MNPLQELSLVSEDAETIRYCDELGATTRTEHALIRELGAGDRVYKRQGAIAKSKEPAVVMVSRAGEVAQAEVRQVLPSPRQPLSCQHMREVVVAPASAASDGGVVRPSVSQSVCVCYAKKRAHTTHVGSGTHDS